MFRMMVAFVSLLLVGFAGSVFANPECASSCSLRCQQLVDQYERIVAGHRDYCGGDQEVCVTNCASRWSDGSCRQYGQDYCGRNPVCIPKCQARFPEGSCRDYGADLCGEAPLRCVQNCTARFSDGSCRDYGPDVCGRRPTCVENCIDRWTDGTCRAYGPDRCSN